ncbi:ABC transporter permease [Halalkalirubrum salinum]|uniref:ABC transporter permease n=1 Tax=Halalkalirubrum salinum TaxID=2563889 RepID=UPI0010FAEF3D|nr:ABC transporter permease [Halalkalirubrum salinum]
MKAYIAKRIAYGIFVMWLVATVVFFGLRAIPGDPVRTMLGPEATDDAVQSLRAELGLDQPMHVQYIDWMTDLAMFEFGRSITKGGPVSSLLADAAPMTLSIGLIGLVFGMSIAIPAGILSATRKYEVEDYAATFISFMGLSMPAFFIGILLAVVFGVWIDLLPIFGYVSITEGFFPWLESLLLPGIAVGLPYGAIVMRMMRSSLLEVMNEPYMKTARAKGVNGRVRLYKHAAQNALIPVVTIAGIQTALLLAGSVTVEIVFGIQGLGQLLVDSILDKDYPVTQGVILVVAGILVFTNIVVDLLYTVLDPRIRYGGEQT